jgi:DEAD/DEAH box helicase domain-containing protein
VNSKEKAKLPVQASLALGLPGFAAQQALVHEPSIEAAVDLFRERLESDPSSPVRAIRHFAARAAQTVPLPDAIDPRICSALVQRGIHELFTHQADAFDHVTAGKNAVVVTPTASGKTLCYNLPVLNTLLADPDARAMYLFPTKALAEDQLHEFQAAVDAAGADIKAFTYDGDTP